VRVRAGTSGYAYPSWRGSFYPDKLPAEQMLSHYARRLPAVEINNTFYRMPSEKLVRGWAAQVPEAFRVVLKAPQRITHTKRLEHAADELAYFLGVSSHLGPRRGPTLFQLPPNLKKDLDRLARFLDLLPPGWEAAFEFRHPSWFEDDVLALLRSRGVALCAADSDAREAVLTPTAAFGYLRLRRPDYTGDDLHQWAGRILAQPWREAFVFFKHEDQGLGPKLAAAFLDAVEAAQASPPAAPSADPPR
jgi:uncharacterized protein YecE (DUF72 family)